jgi:hypothetical protein
MTTNQPEWETVYATDYSKLQVDTTGRYAPELTLVEGGPDCDCPFYVYRIGLDRVYWFEGVLGDNPYHLTPTWYADRLGDAARCCGLTEGELRGQLLSDDPRERAAGYETLAAYFGAHEFDSYPLEFATEEELNAWFND